MYGLIHQSVAIITSPSSRRQGPRGDMFEKTMDERPTAAGPELLGKRRVPFLKSDKGLPTSDGVQLMKPNPELEALLDRANAKGIFGTKMRSVIKLANPHGIAEVVAQQFDEAKRILAKGLVPIIEPEVSIKSPERDAADHILLTEILQQLDALPDGDRVMLKLTIPAEPNLFAPLVAHPKVLRWLLFRRFQPREACSDGPRTRHDRSFSRALLSDLRNDMSDEEFDRSLGAAIDEIHCASVA